MQRFFFNSRRRHILSITFIICSVFFAFLIGASANDNCPKVDDHQVSAIKYQLFTAYHMGFDGYEAPCDIKCLGKSECTQSCQSKKGLESLNLGLKKLMAKNKVKSCASYTMACLEQCQSQGPACAKACEASESASR